MTDPRTLCCPICGRELGVTGHRFGTRWNTKQVWLIKRLRPWMSLKHIGKLFGASEQAIFNVLKDGNRLKPNVPAYTVSIPKAPLTGLAGAPMAAQNGGTIETEAPPPVATDHLPEMVRPPIAAGGISIERTAL